MLKYSGSPGLLACPLEAVREVEGVGLARRRLSDKQYSGWTTTARQLPEGPRRSPLALADY